jgi:hypothetical protein
MAIAQATTRVIRNPLGIFIDIPFPDSPGDFGRELSGARE